MEKLNFSSIDFIGIGGVGMSALARWALNKGLTVSGYDKVKSSITKALEKEGAKIRYQSENIQINTAADKIFVYTPAIPLNNPEILEIKKKKFKLIKRAELLSRIANQGKSIAIAGTHGKTTTSCLTAWILINSGLPVNGFFGGISNNFKSNYVFGTENITIVEADEFDRSFLYLKPDYSLITSTDPDHLDYYKTKSELEMAFRNFAQKSKKCVIHDQIKSIDGESYSLSNKKFGAEEIINKNGSQYFNLILDGIKYKNIRPGVLGEHNIENAIGAAVIAFQLGISPKNIINGIESFKGVKRRFEIHVNNESNIFIDDYAHHPTELDKLINSVKNIFPDRPIAMLFQPHLFSRTNEFLSEFVEILSQVDTLGVLPIFGAREDPIEGVNSQKITNCIPKSEFVPFEDGAKWMCKVKNHIYITAGAGDIDRLVPRIIENLNQSKR
tara:strand:+ start:1480 stop:2808 length:1329 start_codon:yes stop_codon:yes gene_type:complete